MDYNVSYRKKDGSIQCIISYKDNNGKWRTKSKQGFKTQKESKPWQSKTIEELEKRIELATNLELQEITFKEFRDIYLKDIKRIRERNTYEVYRNSLNKFNSLDDKEMNEITLLDIKKIITDLLDIYSISTVKGDLSKVRTLFKKAKSQYRVISENPLLDVEIELPKPKRKNRVRTLTRKELNILVNSINPLKDKLITQFAASGLRVGEVCGLTWDCIDVKNMNIVIERQWKKLDDNTWGFGDLKSANSNRKIPLPKDLLKTLQLYEKTCVKQINNRIINDKHGTNVSNRVNRKYKRLGYDITIHDLRHTYATLLLGNGLDIKTVAEFMGDTVDMIIKTYIHFDSDMYEKGRNKVNELF